jgi:hypothetical protein
MSSNIVGQTIKGKFNSVSIEEDAMTISYRALYYGFKGDKRIPYTSITSVQFREPGSWVAGYIQFSIKGAIEWQGAVSQDENAIVFDAPADAFRALRDFIHSKLAADGRGSTGASLADELTKLASLRDQGILTDEEFESQKKMLLSH